MRCAPHSHIRRSLADYAYSLTEQDSQPLGPAGWLCHFYSTLCAEDGQLELV